MCECVAIIAENKLRISKIKYIVENFNCSCVVCESIDKFISLFNNNIIDFYILDTEDSEKNIVKNFYDFYFAFLKYVPLDMRIVIGNNSKEGFISFDKLNDVFVEKIACRTLRGRPHKLMSNGMIKSLLKQIERYLIDRKFSPKYIGFEYVVDIMHYYLTSDKSRVILSKDVYPELSEKYDKSMYCIERNIRFFLRSNKFLGDIVPDGNFSTKRIIELIYRELRKDVFIQNILENPVV